MHVHMRTARTSARMPTTPPPRSAAASPATASCTAACAASDPRVSRRPPRQWASSSRASHTSACSRSRWCCSCAQSASSWERRASAAALHESSSACGGWRHGVRGAEIQTCMQMCTSEQQADGRRGNRGRLERGYKDTGGATPCSKTYRGCAKQGDPLLAQDASRFKHDFLTWSWCVLLWASS